jgi:hypothetical protein
MTVPAGIGPGQQFQASLDGQLTMVIVPHGSGPNSALHVQIPVRPAVSLVEILSSVHGQQR